MRRITDNETEKEVEFIFNKISELLNQGISINQIKLTNVSNEYIQILKRMSKFYNININNLESSEIYLGQELNVPIYM